MTIEKLKFNKLPKGCKMQIDVKELPGEKIKIKIVDLEFFDRDNLETFLILVFRHVARHDIKNPKLRYLKGDIKIYSFTIYHNDKIKNVEKFLNTMLNAAGKSLWLSHNHINRPRTNLLVGSPGLELEYGYDI